MSDSSIEEALKTSIQSAVIAALGGSEQLVREMVAQTLEIKVDKDGRKAQYSSDEKFTYIEWLSQDLIREAVRKAFQTLVNEQQESVTQQVADELLKQNNLLAKGLVDGLIENIKVNGEYAIKIHFKKDDDWD